MAWFFWAIGCTEIESTPPLRAESGPTHLFGPQPEPPLGLAYEVYVRSFYDTNGDGIGDLDGVTAKLDYLDHLGVEAICLMPIFAADGVGGYGVLDHTRIAGEYGNQADMAELLDAAHDRGLRVLLDTPINSVSNEHPWFVHAQAGGSRDRFIFVDQPPDSSRWFSAKDGSFYYGFSGAALPDLDWGNPDLRLDMLTTLREWLDLGVDGFRLDGASALIESSEGITDTGETHVLLAELRASLSESHPDAVLVAESTNSELAPNQAYLGSTRNPEAHYVLDFPRLTALLTANDEANVTSVRTVLAFEGVNAARHAAFLGSHDTHRLATSIPAPEARRALFAALFTLPGQPVLYYGDELGLTDSSQATGQDDPWRAPMPWSTSSNAGFTSAKDAWLPPDPSFAQGTNVADESVDDGSLLSFVHTLAEIRLGSGPISNGSIRFLDSKPGVLAFERVLVNDVVEVEINFAGVATSGRWGSVAPFGCSIRTGVTVWAAC